MLANDITLNSTTYGGTGGDKVYNLVSLDTTSGVGTLRRVAATATTAPETLRISHRSTKAGTVTTEQHMVRLDETSLDPILGAVQASAWIVLRVPRGTTTVTAASMKTLLGRTISCLLASGATDKVLNGES